MRTIFVFFFGLLAYLAASRNQDDSKRTDRKFKPSPVFQYAGGIGLISVGLGHSYANRKLETQILGGYVPKSIAGQALWVLTIKEAYFPFRFSLFKESERATYLYPASVGILLSIHNLGSQNELPFVINSIVYGYFIRSKVEVASRHGPFEFIEVYTELGGNIHEIQTYLQNKETIKFNEILYLGVGVSLHL